LQKEANKEIRGSKKESSEAKPMLRIQKSSKDKQRGEANAAHSKARQKKAAKRSQLPLASV